MCFPFFQQHSHFIFMRRLQTVNHIVKSLKGNTEMGIFAKIYTTKKRESLCLLTGH
jgi:hypothetical protein